MPRRAFKGQQVLRTRTRLRTADRTGVPANTRVVVMKMVGDEQVRVKIADPNHPELAFARVVANTKNFDTTHRGRPRKEKTE